MSWVAVGITGASLLMSYQAGQEGKAAANKEAKLQRQAGAQRQAAANFEANVLETNATQRIAVAQRDMLDAQRMTRLVQSRAQAVGAASGGGATSPTVLTLMGTMAKDGAVNASRAMYSGEEAARTMRLQAFENRVSGQFAQIGGSLQSEATQGRGRATELQSYASITGTAGGLYGKYGKPGQTTNNTQVSDFGGYTGLDSAGGASYG